MERNVQRTALVSLLIMLTVALAGFAVARFSNLGSGYVIAAIYGLGVLVAAVSWFQLRLRDNERQEQLDLQDSRREIAGALFDPEASGNLPAAKAREQFERFFVPAFTILLCIAQGFLAWYFWNWNAKARATSINQPLVALAFYGLFFFALFLFGKYCGGLARFENQRLLGPVANYLLLGAYLSALAGFGLTAHLAEIPRADFFLTYVLAILLGLLAVESLLSLILEIYRPRVRGKEGLLLYDSRLISLLSHPESLFTTAAHILDYQFGFKVSETWFYRFLQRALAWIILLQFGILLLSTCFVYIETGQQALLERFGKPVAKRPILNPGVHLKWFWPIDRAYRFTNEAIQTFHVGVEHEEEDGDHAETTVLWTVTHYKDEFNLLVANREQQGAVSGTAGGKKIPPVSLLSVSIPVQYQINDLLAWAYNHTDAGELLEKVGTREVVRFLISADMQEIMSTGRFKAADELRNRIQKAADELKLGAKILFVGLQDAHPPVKVAAAYEAVAGASQTRQANRIAAESHRVTTNAFAQAEAVRRTRQAEAARHEEVSGAQARAASFTDQIPAYMNAPSVYRQRAYLQAFARGAEDARKVILATTNTQNIILLDLQDKIRADLLETLTAPPPRTR